MAANMGTSFIHAVLLQLRNANRELAGARLERSKAKRVLRKAEERVREAQRTLKRIEQALEPLPDQPMPKCGACGATLGDTATCLECSAARAFLK